MTDATDVQSRHARVRAARKRGVSGGIPVVRIAGILFRLDYSFFLVFFLILLSLSIGYFPRLHPGYSAASYAAAGAVATLLFFMSIAAHELSHALVSNAAGIRVPTITLFLFGGVSELSEEPSQPGTELRIAAVGPLSSFGMALLFWALYAALAPVASPLTASIALYLAWINAALAIFNLLPGLPLDGGRILRALAWWKTGSLRRATKLAANAGKGIAIGLIVLGGLQIFAGALIGGFWLILIGLFLRGTADAGYRNLILLQSLADVRVADVAVRDPVTVPSRLSLQGLIDEYLLHHGHRAYPVVDGDRVRGLVSIDALRDVDELHRREATVSEHMTPLEAAGWVSPELPASDALRRLADAPHGRLLVLEDGLLRGLLTRESFSRFMEIRNLIDDAGSTPSPQRA